MSQNPIPSLSKVFSLILQEERQHSFGGPSAYNHLSVISEQTGSSMINAVHGPPRFVKGKDKPIYTHCGRNNHTIDKCYKLQDYPPNFVGRGRDKSVPQYGYNNVNHSNNHHGYSSENKGNIHQATAALPDSKSYAVVVIPTTTLILSIDQCNQLISFFQSQLQPQSLSPAQQDTQLVHSNAFNGTFSFTHFVGSISLNSDL